MAKQIRQQRGFSGIIVLVIVGILGVLVFAAWYIYQHQLPSSSGKALSSLAQGKNSSGVYKNWKSYSDSMYGYSFEYPIVGWKTSDNANERDTVPGQPKHDSLTIESSDYVSSDSGVGFHVTSGGFMYVGADKTNATSAEDWLAANSFLSRIADQKKDITVGDKAALRYRIYYESSPTLVTLVVAKGNAYSIYFNYADDVARAKYVSTYEQLVQSFKVDE